MTISEIPGVRIASNPAGELNEITINLKEHPEAVQPLKDLGLIPKTQFDIDFEEGMTPEEFRDALMNVIKEHYEGCRSEASA